MHAHRTPRLPRFSRFALIPVIALSIGMSGCAGAIYRPRPSPRVQVIPDGGSTVLIRDDRTFKVGVMGGGVVDAVHGNPRAMGEARSFETKMTTGFVFSMLGVASAGAGLGIGLGADLGGKRTNTTSIAELGLLGGGVVFALVGLVLAVNAQPHMWNAINIYNDGLPEHPAPPPAVPGYSLPGALPPAPPPPPAAPPAPPP